jgi:hypothetical protein
MTECGTMYSSSNVFGADKGATSAADVVLE